MLVWRICKLQHSDTALSGRGGLYASGRWHNQGRPVVYTATHPALAALEVLVHTEASHAPHDLRLITIDLPDDLPRDVVEAHALPANWAHTPAPRQLRAIGDAWLTGQTTPLLVVPSAVMPTSHNVLLHPLHPDAARCRVVEDVPYSFDRRLLRNRP